MNILLVDSDGRNRNNLSSRLRMQNFSVEIATGGFHSLHILEQEENPAEIYTVILLIEDSEDMSGHEIASHVNALFKKRPPIIYVHKKKFSEQDKRRIEKAGVDEIFLLTEKNFNKLLKTIDKLKK